MSTEIIAEDLVSKSIKPIINESEKSKNNVTDLISSFTGTGMSSKAANETAATIKIRSIAKESFDLDSFVQQAANVESYY